VSSKPIDKSKFKDGQGKYITQGLFIDYNYKDEFAVYCLSDYDKTLHGVTYPSLRRLYIDMADVTEYEFANTHLYGWAHWQKLLKNAAIRTHIDEWREEVELKLRAKAAKAIIAKAESGDFASAKWLADRGWHGKRGRPSKQELEREKKIREKASAELDEDAGRILHLVKKDG
jgi:hypothetical protein